MTDWHDATEKPECPKGQKVAVVFEGISYQNEEGRGIAGTYHGWYLNSHRLHMRDGCECCDPDDEADDFEDHTEHGCPQSGFHTCGADPEGDFSSLYIEAAAVKRWRYSEAGEGR